MQKGHKTEDTRVVKKRTGLPVRFFLDSRLKYKSDAGKLAKASTFC